MNAMAVLDEARRLGASVEVVNGALRLVGVPAGPDGDHLVDLARASKGAIFHLLGFGPTPSIALVEGDPLAVMGPWRPCPLCPAEYRPDLARECPACRLRDGQGIADLRVG